jgi:hypothetical protein
LLAIWLFWSVFEGSFQFFMMDVSSFLAKWRRSVSEYFSGPSSDSASAPAIGHISAEPHIITFKESVVTLSANEGLEEVQAPEGACEERVSFADQVDSYNADVLSWTHLVDPSWWGSSPLSCKEVKDKIAAASASTIVGIYSHHGKSASKKSVSIRFQCEHGRGRLDGGEKSKDKSLSKDIASVDVHAAGTRFVTNSKPAPAHTNMRRSKFSHCQYGFTLTTSDLNESSLPDAQGVWRLSTHHNSEACEVHSGHPKPAFPAGRIMGISAQHFNRLLRFLSERPLARQP